MGLRILIMLIPKVCPKLSAFLLSLFLVFERSLEFQFLTPSQSLNDSSDSQNQNQNQNQEVTQNNQQLTGSNHETEVLNEFFSDPNQSEAIKSPINSPTSSRPTSPRMEEIGKITKNLKLAESKISFEKIGILLLLPPNF